VITNDRRTGDLDVSTWRAAPAESNVARDDNGSWVVLGGDSVDAPEIYFEISAEHPRQVAEFIVAAVQQHAGRMRFTEVIADVERERTRDRSRFTEMAPANRVLPDGLKLACLVGQVGELAGELTDDPFGGRERGKRLYARLTTLAASAVGWMESMTSQTDPPI
jgi:hypothetical protein